MVRRSIDRVSMPWVRWLTRALAVLLLVGAAVMFPGVELNDAERELRLDDASLFAADCRETHTVGSGDTLIDVALRYGAYPSDVAEASGVVDRDLIRIGQVLCIPRDSVRTACQDTIAVRRGDTLRAISQRYSVPIPAIRIVNGITSPHRIYVDQVLCIPEYQVSPTATSIPTPTIVSESGVPCRRMVRVRYGETLGGIARRNNTTVADIVRANPYDLRELRENILLADATLCIP